MTDDRHDPNQELMGQGIASFITPFFGGIHATRTIARTVTNINSGAASPLSGIVHPATLLVIVLAAAPLASGVPLASLAAILVPVALNMGNWREFSRLHRMTLSYKTSLLATFFLTVIFDLSVAVESGLIISCIFFLWRMNTLTGVERQELPGGHSGEAECWKLTGALFFGSVSRPEDVADPERLNSSCAARTVIPDFPDLLNIDNSAMDVLEGLARALKRRGHRLVICGASGHPMRQLRREGLAETLGDDLVATREDALDRAARLGHGQA